MLSVKRFIEKYDGKSVDTGQCVALVRRYLKEVLGLDEYAIPPVGGAKEMYAKAPTRKFRKVKYTGENRPPSGAIVVFDGHAGNPYGHVAIARAGSTKHEHNTFDQNWSRYRRCSRERHRARRDRVIGWLIRR